MKAAVSIAPSDTSTNRSPIEAATAPAAATVLNVRPRGGADEEEADGGQGGEEEHDRADIDEEIGLGRLVAAQGAQRQGEQADPSGEQAVGLGLGQAGLRRRPGRVGRRPAPLRLGEGVDEAVVVGDDGAGEGGPQTGRATGLDGETAAVGQADLDPRVVDGEGGRHHLDRGHTGQGDLEGRHATPAGDPPGSPGDPVGGDVEAAGDAAETEHAQPAAAHPGQGGAELVGGGQLVDEEGGGDSVEHAGREGCPPAAVGDPHRGQRAQPAGQDEEDEGGDGHAGASGPEEVEDADHADGGHQRAPTVLPPLLRFRTCFESSHHIRIRRDPGLT